jgi:hypothetical protein
MRYGMCVVVALAFLSCTNNDVPTDTGSSSAAKTDLTGSWTVQWRLTGTATVPDTTITPLAGGGADTTITDSTVVDSCVASGTLTLTQATPVATVTGPYTVNRTCEGVLVALADSVRVGTLTPDNLFYFFLDKAHQQGQSGTVSGKSVSGDAVWRGLSFAHPPKAPTKHAITGTWSATSP